MIKLIFYSFLLTSLPAEALQNIAGSLGGDQQQLNYIREYMATHRIFDRLDFLPKRDSFRKTNILGKIRQGEQASKEMLWQAKREYPVYTINEHVLAYAIPVALLLWNRQYLWQWFQTISAESKMMFTVLAAIPAVLFVDPISTVCSQIYYAALPPSIPETDLIYTYGSKKNLLDRGTQRYIEDELFYTFWQSPSSESITRLHKILDKALRLPFYTKPLTYNKAKITEALKHFSDELIDRLNRFALAEITFQKMDIHPQGHYPVYFQGAPGTGKSYAAKQLAQAMGTNLAVISLDGATIDDMTGTPFESYDGKAGRLVDAIIANTVSSKDINHKNQVLFVDEFDMLLLKSDKQAEEVIGFLLKLLDPAHRSFYNPYLKTNIRLPDTVILAGNSDIHELSKNIPQLEAMASRLDKVVFEGFSTDAKREIAFESMIPQLEESYQSTAKDMKTFALSDFEKAKIEAFIIQDQDPGLRSLEKYINEIFEMKLQVLTDTKMENEF
ncbi:ATP-binding protein [Endozoicomonas atrinae]|uniref:ATP-binding protein n=1 Tax=Endozoicomonas atrinae TaxID=1333660 RepID=UPI0008269E02|nr:ATP-binding protein [Endozoicomonas atrinae]